jgi:hypothetical protein
MGILPKAILAVLLFACGAQLQSVQLPKDTIDNMDAIVAAAYQAAAAKFPCKVGTRRKPSMLRWQDVDRCLSEAVSRVDWVAFAARLNELRPAEIPSGDFATAVETSLTRQAFQYEKVFRGKKDDTLLPLTHSILKYLPAGSLLDVPVFERSGNPIGTFLGVYFTERTGGLAAANSYRLARFQYRDPQGRIQSPSTRDNLYDSFGVPWGRAKTQPGFRFPIEMLPDLGK